MGYDGTEAAQYRIDDEAAARRSAYFCCLGQRLCSRAARRKHSTGHRWTKKDGDRY